MGRCRHLLVLPRPPLSDRTEMFFKKRSKRSPRAGIASEALRKAPRDQRNHYRKQTARSQPLEATLKVKGWEPISVELVDLTARGAGINVLLARDCGLAVGDLVELGIATIMRSEVVAAAKVANVGKRVQAHVRYGLEFVDLGRLYAQLDPFYARHFNRRGKMRVRPWLDRRVKVRMNWGGVDVIGQMYDLSETGIGVVVSRESAKRVERLDWVDVVFRLPGATLPCSGTASICHRTFVAGNVLVGLLFELKSDDGMLQHVSELRRFVEDRAAEMAKWEESWS
jgi:hypothetical protein